MDSKWFLLSRSVWGVIFIVMAYYGVDIPPEIKDVAPDLTVRVVDNAIALFGFLMFLYGSVKREKKLTVLPKAKLPWRKA